MFFSTQEKIYTANKHIKKAIMYWPIVPVQRRGVEDLQRKSMEERCKQCRLDNSACTISRSKQTKKWRTSCGKCSQEKYKCGWDNDASLGSKSWKPVASEPEMPRALVATPNHPIKIGPPRGAPKLVYQPHGTTRTRFTIRVPPPSRAEIPAPAHHTPLPAACHSPPLPPSRRPPRVSHREPREMDANAIHPGPEIARMKEAIPSPAREVLDAVARLPLPSPSPLPICPREAVDAPPPDITLPRSNTPFEFPSSSFPPTPISPHSTPNPSRQDKMPLNIPETPHPSPGPPSLAF
ncbi:hypothetical protein SERLA73DRAFT_69972 [Serpula lacrymans var. lacrymans S7.3]|uniref:Uncharacterized protein n=1 Tax=Serpula lacrymans var. lacrymans (strain S7.3) TaxID=936435 RepID=F8PLI8_SERL3|nr:hypothetical protein SERLA73DRAFT_69972 [Serpula lacrymans var. lacrymans S7.3]